MTWCAHCFQSSLISAPHIRRLDEQMWYGAVILKWANDRALIHYIGWQTMWNEWFSREDMLNRTRPLTATPVFGVLSTKDERNRMRRCINLADELWGKPGEEGGNENGQETDKEESEADSASRSRDSQESESADAGVHSASADCDGQGEENNDADNVAMHIGSIKRDEEHENKNANVVSDESGSPADSNAVGGSSDDQLNPSEDNPVADRQALLDFLESMYAQQARADTARQIEAATEKQAAAAGQEDKETPSRGDQSNAAESEEDESDESDEEGLVSETESDEEISLLGPTGTIPAAALISGPHHAKDAPAALGPDMAGPAGDSATSAGMGQALTANEEHSFLHSSMHAFNGAINALDKKLSALGIELYPPGWGKELADRESIKADRVAASNCKAVKRFKPSDIALLFNRGLCHHYSRHYLEAEADFDLVLHCSAEDIE